MFRIAICDDSKEFLSEIEKEVAGSLEKQGEGCEIKCFSDSTILFNEIAEGLKVDLLFLDIEMPGVNGISLTEKVKKYLPEVLTILITSHEKYVYDSFKVQPFRFVPKKYMKEMLFPAIRDAVEVLRKCENRFIYIENRDGLQRLGTRTITYIHHKGKYAYIELSNGKCEKVRKTLKQVYEELPKPDFIWLDRGCICNMLYISRISKGDIILNDETKLRMGRERITEIKNEFRKYWTGTEGS